MSAQTAAAAGDALVVTGAGMVTSVGHDRASAAAAIRAGISRFQEVPDCATTAGAAFTGSLAYGLTDGRSGAGRLNAMAIPALREALFSAEGFSAPLSLETTRMFLSLPAESRPGYDAYEADDLALLLELVGLEALRPSAEQLRSGAANVLPAQLDAHRAGAEIPPTVELQAAGQTGMIDAVLRAEQVLRTGAADACLVGGVDSLVEFPGLLWFDEQRRVKTDDRSTGFIPGEASAFLVLELASMAEQRGAAALAELVGVHCAHETASLESGEVLRGIGLATAIAGTLETAALAYLPEAWCDLNGEYYRSKEWVLALGRLAGDEPEPPALRHPAESIGDVGAATGGVLVATAASALQDGWAASDAALVWASSDDGARGSVLVRRPGQEG